MTLVNIGSINIDHVYSVDHLVQPGETVLVQSHAAGLGGKGANQSIAAARAGASVRHIGAVGRDGKWTRERLAAEGIDVSGIAEVSDITGNAVIQVDRNAENAILVHSGANLALTEDQIEEAILSMGPDDWVMLQNETNLTADIVRIAKAQSVKVAYSAAPFIAETVLAILDSVDLVCVNEGEASALADALGIEVFDIPVPVLLMTKGRNGAVHVSAQAVTEVPSFKVDAVDTTGAGDTFFGYFMAGLDQGEPVEQALGWASAAAAIQVSRAGAADAIPSRDEVQHFFNSRV